MAETADPPTSTPTSPPPPTVAPAAPSAEAKQPLSVRSLLEAGAHFGHQTRRWNPKMRSFIFGERNGIHIIDLDQTYERFQTALEFVRETIAQGGRVLFVGTKRQAQAPIRFEAERAGQFYVNNRWLGGMLTNFKTVKKSIERFKDHLALVADDEKRSELSKKELARINRAIERYRKSLDGIKEMERLPSVVFVVDVKREEIAVSEARRLGIPIVAVVDTNCDPESIDFVIPANDDATRALQLYCSQIADVCVEGAELFNERVQSEVADEESKRGPQREAEPATGRVVVEIHHPPRRGRGTGRRDVRDEAPKVGEPTVAEPAPVGETPPTSTDGPA